MFLCLLYHGSTALYLRPVTQVNSDLSCYTGQLIRSMSFTLFDTILQSYQQTLSWKQSFLLPPGENSDLELDLCCAVGTDAVTPLKATDQPAPNRYIADSCYRFPNKYRGKAAMDDVIDLLKKSLPGSNFILQTGVKSSGSFIRRTLVCGHNLTVQDRLKSKKFEGDSYIQSGVREENIKSKKSAGELSSFDLMSTKSKLKSKQATKSRKTSGYSLNHPSNRPTTVYRSASKDSRCKCFVSVMYSDFDGFYYLDKNSNINHTGHQYIPPSAKSLSSTEVSEELNDLIQRLASVGVSASKISDFVNSVDENEATIDNKTIHNMIQKETNIKSSKLGITSCMTTAEKAIAYLNQ